jgi:hypothetical protein
METKKCSKCGKIKTLDIFYWRKDNGTYRNDCKECQRARSRIYRLNNAEKIEAYRKNNIDKITEYNKKYNIEWRKKNIEHKKQEAKQWYKNNTEITKTRSKERYKNNIGIERERRREYYKNNAKRIYEKQKKQHSVNPCYNAWFRNKRKSDPVFRLNCNIKTAISMSLKGNKNGWHWENIINFTLQDLISHLEKQFKDGMSWDNYGKWHVDHIIPITWWKFIAYSDKEFKQCWALCNLQPLWAIDNIKKGNRIV